MTVSYNLDMSTSTSGSFLRLLFRWRGSVWKSVLNEVIVWTLLYYAVFAIYVLCLTEDEQKAFEGLARHINDRMELIPLHFMLGFFVTIVVDRWKQIFQNIGFVDSAAYFIGTYVRGDEPQTRMARRNCIRYLCLTQVLILRDISIRVRKRFPNMDSLLDSGLLHPHERALMDGVGNGFTKYWMPIHWTFGLCHDLRAKGKIGADLFLNTILQEVKLFREQLQMLCNYDWVPVPLAYPQVVFLAVRIYFLLCLVCRQYRWHEHADGQNQVDRVVPVMTLLELFFIMGWLKVAEALLNPLGEDDDDFECNYIIDRNLAIAMAMVDDCYDQKPALPNVDNDGDEDELKGIPNGGDKSPEHGQQKPVPTVPVAKYSEQSAADVQHPLVGSATLSHLPEERKHVRMVERAQKAPNEDDISSASSSSSSGHDDNGTKPVVHRRHSNLTPIFRRVSSSLSLGTKLRSWRQSITLPIRRGAGTTAVDNREGGGSAKVGDIAKPTKAPKGWPTAFGKAPAATINSPGCRSMDELENGKASYGVDSRFPQIATAPDLRRQLSSPVSPTAEVRSLQLHHLEPVKEDENLEAESAPETAQFDLSINREDEPGVEDKEVNTKMEYGKKN